MCSAFRKAYPDAVRCAEFGRTPEGRPMLALIVTRTGALTALSAHRRRIPVLLVQAGIHAGEIDGKDAGFLALRELLDGRVAPGALAKQVLVFVPVFNVDGHERFGRWNRPNQRGPVEMGWRTTAQNFNLNRDYAKADSPEMQAMLRLVDEWDPLAYHRPPRHRRRQVRARHLDPGRTAARRGRGASGRGSRAARRRDRRPPCAGLAADAVLPLVRDRGRSRVGIRRQRVAAALFDRLFPVAQSIRDARRNAFVEGVPDTCAHHPQHDRVGRLADRRPWEAMASRSRAKPTRAPRGSPARPCRRATRQATSHGPSRSEATNIRGRRRRSRVR